MFLTTSPPMAPLPYWGEALSSGMPAARRASGFAAERRLVSAAATIVSEAAAQKHSHHSQQFRETAFGGQRSLLHCPNQKRKSGWKITSKPGS